MNFKTRYTQTNHQSSLFVEMHNYLQRIILHSENKQHHIFHFV